MRFRRQILVGLTLLFGIGLLLFWSRKQGGEVPAVEPVRLPGTTLIIDAGHGGEDGGAVSPGGTAESTLNLSIALRLKAVADLYGVRAVLLRDSDRSLHDPEAETLREKKVSDLKNRVQIIENTPNASLISIHQNTFPDPAYRGAQVFYRQTDPDSMALAQRLQDGLRTALDPQNHREPAQIPDSVYLMKRISCPAVLVECGFLSHPAEERLLQSESYQTKLALVLASVYLYDSNE